MPKYVLSPEHTPGASAMRVVTFKLEEDILEKLDGLAREKGVTRSEVIRKAIELYLKLEDFRIQPQPKVVRLLS